MSTLSPAQSINPANGQLLASYAWASRDEVAAAIAQSRKGFDVWRQMSVADRAAGLRTLAAAIRNRAEEMALCITREMGKPILQARAEVTKSAALCDWYAQQGPAMLATEQTLVEGNKAVIEYRPLGPILAVMPWNFPLWQVIRGAAPILLAGNSYLLKHAPNVMGCATLIGQIAVDAGLPTGVFGWVNATNDGVSQAINDPRIAAVTVTGSVRAGDWCSGGCRAEKMCAGAGRFRSICRLKRCGSGAGRKSSDPRAFPEQRPGLRRVQALYY